MKLPLFISRRYFFSKNNLGAINLITFIAILGNLFGSFALLCLLSILNGFESVIFKVYENTYPDIKIQKEKSKVFPISPLLIKQLKKNNKISSFSCVIEDNAILQYNGKQIVVLVKGVDKNFIHVIKKDSFISAGNGKLHGSHDSANGFAWIGDGLQDRMGISSNDKKLLLSAPRRETFGVAQMEMNEEEIYASTIIKPGEELEQTLVVVPKFFAQKLFEREDSSCSAIEIKCTNKKNIGAVQEFLKQELGNSYTVKSRAEQNEAVYKMFVTEKWFSFGLMMFVMFIISFNLIGSLTMLVLEKRKDILLLSHLGLETKKIGKIFFNQGFLIVLTGSILGLILAIIIVLLQQKIGFIRTGTDLSAPYPIELRWMDVLLTLAMSLILGFICSIQPAKKSMQSL